MITLTQITEIAVLIFVAFYVVGTFWKPLIINKKSLLKKILAKQTINKISMEFDQALLKIERENAQGDLKQLQKQILDMKTLKEDKQKELTELKKNSGDIKKWEDKNKEILEIDGQATKLLREEETMNRMIKMAEAKIGQYTKELSLLERSIELGKKLIKDL